MCPLPLIVTVHVCCRVDPKTSACPNSAKFNVLAWLSTRGYWNEPNKTRTPDSYTTNDGAVLFVQPATDQNMEPVPLKLHSFGRGRVPSMSFSATGFPRREDEKFRQGCSVLTEQCVQHMGYNTTQAPQNADTSTAGQDLDYYGDNCGGNSGGVVTTVLNGETVAFAIVTAADSECEAEGRSKTYFTQNVDQGRDYGVRLDLLSAAVSHGLSPPR